MAPLLLNVTVLLAAALAGDLLLQDAQAEPSGTSTDGDVPVFHRIA